MAFPDNSGRLPPPLRMAGKSPLPAIGTPACYVRFRGGRSDHVAANFGAETPASRSRKRTGGFKAFHGEKRTFTLLQFGRALILMDIDKSCRALCVPALN